MSESITDNIDKAVDNYLGITNEDTSKEGTTDTTESTEASNDAVDAGTDAKPAQPTSEQVVKEEQPKAGRLPANETGDLIDPSTGAVIAKAGNERRYFEQWRKDNNTLRNTQRELETANAHLSALREAAQLPTKLGLEPAEVDVAMKFMAHWKQDPVGAAKQLLTEVRALGHNIEDLGQGIDMAAMQRMIDAKLAPLTSERQQQQQEAATRAAIDEEVNAVMSREPWLANQQQELIMLMEADEQERLAKVRAGNGDAHKTLTLREAGLMLKAYALEHGFDLYSSIREQSLRPATQVQRPNRAAIPAPAVNNDVVPRRASVSDDLDTRSIVAQALAEAGINYSYR